MTKLKYMLITASLSVALHAGLSIAAETGSALKNDNLRYEPYADAKVTGSFSRGESLQILKKQGAWLQVKTKKNTGWVRLLSVKRGTTSTGNQTAGVLAAASGRAGTGQVVSTTGIRGLSEQELKAAKFNETEVKALESYTSTTNQGKQFATAGGLKTVAFSNLKAPLKTPQETPGGESK
ncbi:MAG TPA: SH3 domain-containing protein [Methylotenera sp.]|nr:SH3 domain-containing protein [Methylotenera sp.]